MYTAAPPGTPATEATMRSGKRLHGQRGFAYVAVLLALVLLGLTTNGVMSSVSQQAQREREAELLRTG